MLKLFYDLSGLISKKGERQLKEDVRNELEALILQSYESMYRTALVYMKNEQDAMDVVQESIVKAIKNAGQIKELSFMKTWLYRIVINTALDELEKRKKILPLFSEDEEIREDRYQDPDIARNLQKLDHLEKTVILLRYFEEWKLEEIAEYLGKNLNTVKSILYRSLKKLRTEMMKGEAVS